MATNDEIQHDGANGAPVTHSQDVRAGAGGQPGKPEEPGQPEKPKEPEKPGKPGKRRKRRIWLRVLLAVIGLVVVAFLVFVGLFAWNRWYRYDDVADIQGKWYAPASVTTVDVTADTIVFDPDTSYRYSIDPHAKTIRYSLVDLEGEGRYWFTCDRQTLVIVDGRGYDANSTALEDLNRWVEGLLAQMNGAELALPEGDGVIVLTREPDIEALAAQASAKVQAAEQKVAEQEAAQQEAAGQEAAGQEQGGDASAEAVQATEAGEEVEDAEAAESEETTDAGTPGASQDPPDREFANESVGIFE